MLGASHLEDSFVHLKMLTLLMERRQTARYMVLYEHAIQDFHEKNTFHCLSAVQN